jgi:hypothetical protein
MISYTSLMHPTMIAKIRQGIKYAALGQGHMMNGHDSRVYIQDRHGRNIMRINWLKVPDANGNKIIVYGDNSRIITATVIKALQESNQ